MAGECAADQLLGGRYSLVEVLGSGASGVVWRARDQLLQRDVAVKEIRFPFVVGAAEDSALRDAILREARAAARLNHSGAVTVYDVVEDDGRPLIVMELVDAPTLSEMVEANGPLPPKDVAAIGSQLLDALDAGHASGIVHRDVKPRNVMVSASGRVRLADFGVAAVIDDARMTSGNAVIGSPAFMAPEQVNGADVGPAADIWALGATLYFAVEGQPPYDKGSAIPTMTAIVLEPPRPVERAGPLAPLLGALLAKDPADRPTAPFLRLWLANLGGSPATSWSNNNADATSRFSVLPDDIEVPGPVGSEVVIPSAAPSEVPGPPPGPTAPSPAPAAAPVPIVPGPGPAPVPIVPGPAPEPTPTPSGPEPAPPDHDPPEQLPSPDPPTPVLPAPEPERFPPEPEPTQVPPAPGPEQVPPTQVPPAPEPERFPPEPEPTQVPPAPVAGPPLTPTQPDVLVPPTEPAGGGASTDGLRAGGVPAGRAAVRPTPMPTGAGGGARRRVGGPWLVAVVAALVAVALAAVLLGGRDDGGGVSDGQAAPPDASSSGSSSGSSSVAVPADWVPYSDPATGFTISHPPGWTVVADASLTDFRDPATGAYLRIDHIQPPGPSPEGAWLEFEPRFAAENAGYQRIRIVPTTYAGFPAAIWEFTYGGDGARLRAVDLGFVTGTYGFALNFQTPESDWDRLQPVFEAFKASFRAPS